METLIMLVEESPDAFVENTNMCVFLACCISMSKLNANYENSCLLHTKLSGLDIPNDLMCVCVCVFKHIMK